MAEWSIKCPQCGSTELFLKSKGSALGAYCVNCGRWIKWVNKKEENLIRQRAKKMVAIKDMGMPKCCCEVIEKKSKYGDWIDASIKRCPLYNICEHKDSIKNNFKPDDCPLVEVEVQE